MYLPFLLLLAIFTKDVTSLQCYVYNGLAADEGNVTTLVSCPSVDNQVCYKISGNIGGIKSLARGCIIEVKPSTCNVLEQVMTAASDAKIDDFQCHTCTTDGCNGSNSLVQQVHLIKVFVIAFIMIAFCNK